MKVVALLLMLQDTLVCSAELSLIERVAILLGSLLDFLLNLLVVLCYLILNEIVGTIALL